MEALLGNVQLQVQAEDGSWARLGAIESFQLPQIPERTTAAIDLAIDRLILRWRPSRVSRRRLAALIATARHMA